MSHVKSRGPHDAPFVLVGEQPGTMEIRRGEPFVGPAGKELDKCLDEAGIHPGQCFFTNTIQEYPPKIETFLYYPKTKAQSPKWHAAGEEWVAYLKKELELTSGIIIAIGNAALFALTERWGISKWAGSVLESTLLPGRKVIPTLHPATILPPKNKYPNRYLIIKDLSRALDLHLGTFVPETYSIKTTPSYFETLQFLTYLLEEGKGKYVPYDIETSGKGVDIEVNCISFSLNKHAISIPFAEPSLGGVRNYFSAEQETEIWFLIAKLLENPNIIKLGQNLAFDNHFLFRKYGIVLRNFRDTMVAQNILLGNMYSASEDNRKDLGSITRHWTRLPYYKDDGKEFIAKGEGKWETFWQYNGLDSVAVDIAFPNMMPGIKALNNEEIFERQCRVISILTFMMERGIKINVQGIERHREATLNKIEAAKDELEEIVRSRFGKLPSWYTRKMKGSGPQLSAWFHDELKCPEYKTAAGKVGFDVNVLKRLIRLETPGAAQVRDIRALEKQASNYMNLNKIDSDARLRCFYNPAGTRYSRLSSRASIFGTGMNLQNWPHELLSYLEADDGYVIYYPDLGQAENRIVAYVSESTVMMDAFESGKDVHSITASSICGLDSAEIKRQDDEHIYCNMGDGTKTWRFWGKKANHGLNYDLGYRKFAFYYEIPEVEGKKITDAYHSLYPEVRKNFHVYVRSCLRKTRTLSNLLGRTIKFFDKLEDKLFKEAYSYIPQGTVGDIMFKAMDDIDSDPDLRPLEILIQVHDSLGFQIPVSLGWEKHLEMLKKVSACMSVPLTTPRGLTFTIPVDFVMGWNFNKSEQKKIDPLTCSPSDIASIWELLETERDEKRNAAKV